MATTMAALGDAERAAAERRRRGRCYAAAVQQDAYDHEPAAAMLQRRAAKNRPFEDPSWSHPLGHLMISPRERWLTALTGLQTLVLSRCEALTVLPAGYRPSWVLSRWRASKSVSKQCPAPSQALSRSHFVRAKVAGDAVCMTHCQIGQIHLLAVIGIGTFQGKNDKK